MYTVDFEIQVNDKNNMHVFAQCRSITDKELIGLTLRFTHKDGTTIMTKFDMDFLEDVEKEAITQLLDEYYNNTNYAM